MALPIMILALRAPADWHRQIAPEPPLPQSEVDRVRAVMGNMPPLIVKPMHRYGRLTGLEVFAPKCAGPCYIDLDHLIEGPLNAADGLSPLASIIRKSGRPPCCVTWARDLGVPEILAALPQECAADPLHLSAAAGAVSARHITPRQFAECIAAGAPARLIARIAGEHLPCSHSRMSMVELTLMNCSIRASQDALDALIASGALSDEDGLAAQLLIEGERVGGHRALVSVSAG